MSDIDINALLDDPRIAIGEQAAGDNPAGEDIRDTPEYDALDTEFRKMESDGPTAVKWKQLNIDTLKILGEKSKDLILASRLVFGLFREEGYKGLAIGCAILEGMSQAHWEGLIPGMARERARAGSYDWIANKIAPGVEADPPQGEATMYALVAYEKLDALDNFLSEKMVKYPVALGPLIRALRPHAQTARDELRARAEAEEKAKAAAEAAATAEPVADTPQPAPPAQQAPAPTPQPTPQPTPAPAPASPPAASSSAASNLTFDLPPDAQGGDDKAVQALLNATTRLASGLRHANPADPKAYLCSRFAIWASLNSAPLMRDGRSLLPPPQKARLDEVQALTNAGNHAGLVMTAESIFFSSPFWLDAHYLIDRSMQALGQDYDAARMTVRGQLAAFLAKVPELTDMAFNDGMPFASAETQAWIRDEITAGSGQGGDPDSDNAKSSAYQLGQKGEVLPGLKILTEHANSRPSGRARFQARLNVGDYCLRFGLLQPLFALIQALENIAAQQNLNAWDPDLVVALANLSWRAYTHKNAGQFIDEQASIQHKKRITAILADLDIVMAAQLTASGNAG